MKKKIDYNDIYANSERHIKKAVAYSRNKKRKERCDAICEYFEKSGCLGVVSEKESLMSNSQYYRFAIYDRQFCRKLIENLSHMLAVDEMHLNNMKNKEVPDI